MKTHRKCRVMFCCPPPSQYIWLMLWCFVVSICRFLVRWNKWFNFVNFFSCLFHHLRCIGFLTRLLSNWSHSLLGKCDCLASFFSVQGSPLVTLFLTIMSRVWSNEAEGEGISRAHGKNLGCENISSKHSNSESNSYHSKFTVYF